MGRRGRFAPGPADEDPCIVSRVAIHPGPLAEAGSTSILAENLSALARRSPRVAEAVRRASPRDGLQWRTTDHASSWSAELDGRALASRRDPVREAEVLAESVDFKQVGAAVVLGFGLGYHVAALARRAGGHSMVLVYEPDVALLRSVLEHADLAAWLRDGRVMLFTDAEDGGAISESLTGLEALIGLGVSIIEHAPSRARLAGRGARFAETFTRVVAACRTQVVTTMTQMEATFRNLLMNADRYAGMHGCAGIADLADAARGFPAIVVSAGPSLERNLHLLADPAVRERCVIIAVQTVLKPMLARGIKPHFVTALDFHEISRRFYEGLTPADVEGITLVVEPKANAAIVESFPGKIRLTGAETLDVLLGTDLAGTHGVISPGATVAHLSYYLARHMGCDPVMLIGQDLAFTDGQYYAAGAAIHDVWSTELNPFNTLETMEWQRIVRWRGHLRRLEDHLGRPVYTDEQMSTYLAQFERDFLADKERGLTTIDATEGGARKAHTKTMALGEALERHLPRGSRLPEFAPPAPDRVFSKSALRDRLASIRDDARMIAYLSRETAGLLKRMGGAAGDEARINALIERVHELRDKVQSKKDAYNLVHRLNQAGTYKRLRADRALGLDDDLTPVQVQSRQIERDTVNVTWFGDAASALGSLLQSTLDALEGAPKLTSDPVAAENEEDGASRNDAAPPTRVAAVIPVDMRLSALGTQRALSRETVEATLGRLARVTNLAGVVLITNEPDQLSALMNNGPRPWPLHIMRVESDLLRAVSASVRAARLWARTCWRGGIGGMTCYDEAFDPVLARRALEQFGYSSAMILGIDWSEIDPELSAQVLERHTRNPRALPFTFTQAPPGLAACVIGLDLIAKLAEGRAANDPHATIGGLLGFRPSRPRRDPIAEACCIQIPAEMRSRQSRFIGARCEENAGPSHLVLEINSDRFVPDAHAAWMSTERARSLIEQCASMHPGAVLTLHGRGDPLFHPGLPEIIRAARSAGIAGVHVRTDALADEAAIDALLESEPEVISVDLRAENAATYAALTGGQRLETAVLNTQRLLSARRFSGGLPRPWIVPRITRCDAVYAEIENSYDRALIFAGAGVIDPMPRALPGQRIAPLPLPRGAIEREAFSRLFIRCDGAVIADESDPDARERVPAGSAIESGVAAAWGTLIARRRAAMRDHGHTHPDLRTLP